MASLIVIILFAAAAAGALAWALALRRQAISLSRSESELRTALDNANVENATLRERVEQTRLNAEAQSSAQEARFKVLAAEILETNARQLDRRSQESLSQVVNPLKERILEFQKKVDDTYSSQMREHTSLAEQIKQLMTLNQAIDKQAGALASALKGDTRVQGNWGELVLERILERSGLQKGREFDTQKVTVQGKRPDVVVYYPGGHCMIIDSKVSLTAFFRLLDAGADDARRIAADAHVASVKAHVKELAMKSYQDLIGDAAADFVMMFIPNEPAYMAALRHDPELWEWAYDQRVLIVSPTHLVSALKLVEHVWRHDRQARNAIEIANRAGDMYDKLAAFVDDMTKIAKSLDSATDACNAALNKLSRGRGNLLTRAEILKQLGAKASKQMKINPELSEDNL